MIKKINIMKSKLNIKEKYQKIKYFSHNNLWNITLNSIPFYKRIFIALLRIIIIVYRRFRADKCVQEAYTLAFITVMAMIPLLASLFSVFKGLGAQEKIRQIFEDEINNLPPHAADLLNRSFSYVEQTNLSALGILGLVFLFWAVITTIGHVERTFNSIWMVPKPRRLFRKLTDYLSIIVVVPLLIISATSVNALLTSESISSFLQERFGQFIWIYNKSFGFSILFIGFSFLYYFMPNTKVTSIPALAGGLWGAFLWYIAQKWFLEFQIYMIRVNPVYGTFTAIPFFLLWLYLNWIIILLGSELSFAVQNYKKYIPESKNRGLNFSTLEMIGIVITFETCKNFYNGHKSWSADEFSRKNCIDWVLLSEAINVLTKNRIIIPVVEKDYSYNPGKDLGNLTIGDIEDAFRGTPSKYITENIQSIEPLKLFSDSLNKFSTELYKINFRELIETQK